MLISSFCGYWKHTMNKKGQMNGLNAAPQFITTLGVIGIIGAVMLLIIDQISNSGQFTGAAANALGNITEAIANFFSLTPVLGFVFIAVILLLAVGSFLALTYFRNR